MPEVSIRPVEENELPRAFTVLHELRDQLDWATFVSGLNRLRQQGYQLYGAFEGPIIVGLMSMRPVETMARGRHLHIDDLVVTAGRRGQGIGAKFLAVAEHHARQQGLLAVFLDSRQEAIGFYQKLGFAFHTAPLMRKGLQS